MTSYEFKNIAILNVKGVDFRCILQGTSKTEAANISNNSVLEDKGVQLDLLKNIDQIYYCSDYYDVSVNKYGVQCG